MLSVKGYRIIDLSLSEDHDAIHQIYLKEHMDKKANGKVLFVGNIDIKRNLSVEDLDKLLKLLFIRYGDIDEISISDLDASILTVSRFAHITFNKKASVKLALNAADKNYAESWIEVRRKMGFITNHGTVKTANQLRKAFAWKMADHEQMKVEVDEAMKEFEIEEEREKLEHQAARQVPDDDGFVLVASKNKRKREEDPNVNRNVKQRNRKQKKNLELKNFYRFQIKEEKMKQLDVLRRKFEEDKERVAKMKESRKFKPF